MKKILFGCLVIVLFCGILKAENLISVTEHVSLWIDNKYTHERSKNLANKKCNDIVFSDKTDAEKIADLKKAFPEAFKKEELPLIFTPPVSYHIHSLALGYDIQESSTQTITTVDIFKKINSSKTQNESSEKKDIRSQHQVNADVSAGNEFSLNPFTWLKVLFGTKVKLSGSYAYGRDSVSQQSELWSRSQQEIFSRESSQISEMIHQTNIKNFHLTFTVSITNNSNEKIHCNLKQVYIPVYGEHGAYNITAKPYGMPIDILEIEPYRTKDITFRMELDTTQGRALATYMASNSPTIDILQGGNFPIYTESGKDAIGATLRRVNTSAIKIHFPEFTGTWNIRVNHTSNGKLTTLQEALTAISDDFENAFQKFNIFQYENGDLISVSSIPFGEFAENDKHCRYIAFLQIGNKIYDKVNGDLLNANLSKNGYVIWMIDLNNLDDYENIHPAMKKFIYEKVETMAKNGFLNKGNAEAQLKVADMYLKGFYVKQSAPEAVKWIRKAAEQGHADAQAALGLCYYNGLGVAKDITEAVKWFRKAAEQGDAEAQCNLGACYQTGLGVPKDMHEAVKWYRKAAEQGVAEAQCLLGLCYEGGIGVEKNYAEAVKWYRKAAEQGHATAQNNLALRYYNGEGVEQNYTEAVKWFRKAAEQGDAEAQCNLGACYQTGLGVPKDMHEAVKWYRKAVEQGHADAQFLLGLCYEVGIGVEKNYAEAVKWFRKAAEQGDADAQNKLKKLGKTW